uniref:WW domain-containing protein n=1 Tax=Parastrongyloides trichosuri TaxID=131310 RepID=A0A0N4Z985_PARTI
MSLTALSSMSESIAPTTSNNQRFHETIQESPLFKRMYQSTEEDHSHTLDETIIVENDISTDEEQNNVKEYTFTPKRNNTIESGSTTNQNLVISSLADELTSSSTSSIYEPISDVQMTSSIINPMTTSYYENVQPHKLFNNASTFLTPSKYYGKSCHVEDNDEHVYANLSEITQIDRAPDPPMPEDEDVPIRILPTGWREYKTPGGRSYFYHPVMQVCQWKPPRTVASPFTTFNNFQQKNNQPSTSSTMLTSTIVNNSETSHCNIDNNIMSSSTPNNMERNNIINNGTEYIVNKKSIIIEHPELSESGEYFSHPTSDQKCYFGSDNNTFDSRKISSEVCGYINHNPTIHEVGEMINSSDSGIVSGGQTSISYNNSIKNTNSIETGTITKGGRQYNIPEMISKDGHVRQTLEKLKSIDFSNPPILDSITLPSPTLHVSQSTSTKKGSIEKCKIIDINSKTRKKEWLRNFMVLSKNHLLFYKDEKSAEKHGKHYEAPLGVCDLKNAHIIFIDKRKKPLIEIKTTDSEGICIEYQIEGIDRNDTLNWYSILKNCTTSLPSPDGYQSPSCDVTGMLSNPLQRNSSFIASRNVPLINQQQQQTSIMSKSTYSSSKSMKKGKSMGKGDTMISSMIENIPCVDTINGEPVPTKESIIERLLRFFRSRPSIESLRDRGIYRPEPVFGSTLEIICKQEQSIVPKFLTVITKIIEEKGLETDGLYRVSGNLSTIQKIRCKVDQYNYDDIKNEEDVHVLTGTLKLFFRELSEPLFPINMNKDFVNSIQTSQQDTRFTKIDDLLNKLPLVNKNTLIHLLRHLQKVSNYSSKNRMQIHNLAIVFGPTLFGCDDRPIINKGKNTKDTKNSSSSKKKIHKKEISPPVIQPNQNLAFKMIMYGQVLEFVLTKLDKFAIFKDYSTSG